MTETYKEIVTRQISQIASNIFIKNGILYDQSVTPFSIAEVITERYKVKLLDHLSTKEFREFLLTNWIYVHYYQARETPPESDRIDERHFPFKYMSLGGKKAFWRNRFWQYDEQTKGQERAALTRGYETRFVQPQQSVEDDLVFEEFTDDAGTILTEVHYMSMIFPKFEIRADQKFVFGKYPVDDDGQGGIIRFYFHLDTVCMDLSIPVILTKITSSFNERLIPFQVKFPPKAEDFARADHFLLYLERRHFFIGGWLLRSIYNEIKEFLNPQLPYFVREVLPGIGFATSPHDEALSFGVNRSRVMAMAIITKLEVPASKPVLEYLAEKWKRIEYFYLNPYPPFLYDFELFTNPAPAFLFQDVSGNDALAAAWYIARLLAREAIWVVEGQCNWMNYQEISSVRKGYRMLTADHGLSGINGVIVFLEAFRKIGIRDSGIEYVLAGAKAFYAATANNDGAITNTPRATKMLFSVKQIVVLPQGFASDELKSEIMKIIYEEPLPKLSDYLLINAIIKEHIERERPIGNRLDGSNNFCADMEYGFAGYGYAYLRLYDPRRVPRL